jgi:predicted transcriptional regulator
MSNKEAVIEIMRKLPEEVTLEEIVEEIQILAAIQQGEKEVREGRVISHEDVKQRLASWLTK